MLQLLHADSANNLMVREGKAQFVFLETYINKIKCILQDFCLRKKPAYLQAECMRVKLCKILDQSPMCFSFFPYASVTGVDKHFLNCNSTSSFKQLI